MQPPLDKVADSPIGPLADRLVSVLLLVVAAGFVAILWRVTPDLRGFGTHEQLGMQACSWPAAYGRPCPTCGVTTAAAYLVQLRPDRAVATHPFGAALAGFGLWLAGVAASCLLLRRSFLDYLLRLSPVRTLACGGVLLLGSWLFLLATFAP